LESELERELGAEVECVAGSSGAFEISVEGTNVFSKKNLKRFPRDGEILALIKKMK